MQCTNFSLTGHLIGIAQARKLNFSAPSFFFISLSLRNSGFFISLTNLQISSVNSLRTNFVTSSMLWIVTLNVLYGWTTVQISVTASQFSVRIVLVPFFINVVKICCADPQVFSSELVKLNPFYTYVHRSKNDLISIYYWWSILTYACKCQSNNTGTEVNEEYFVHVQCFLAQYQYWNEMSIKLYLAWLIMIH